MDSQPALFAARPLWFTEMSLTDSFRPGECLVCSNLIDAERHAIHSFLWEGMMSSEVRGKFLQGGGFCTRHFWMAKRLEDDGWPAGGIGLAILCENLVEHVIADLPRVADLARPEPVIPFRRKKDVRFCPPGAGCMFCRDWIEREESLIAALEGLKNKLTWSEKLERSPLCVHHSLVALRVWRGLDDKQHVRKALGEKLRQLHTDLKEFIRKHDWNHRGEALGRERDSVERAIQALSGLQRQFPVPRMGSELARNSGG
jgi:hypothetical protein